MAHLKFRKMLCASPTKWWSHFLVGVASCPHGNWQGGPTCLSSRRTARGWSWTTLIHYCYSLHVPCYSLYMYVVIWTTGTISRTEDLSNHLAKRKKLKKRDEHILTLDRRRKKTGHGEKSNPFPFLVPASFFSFSFFLAFL